ncbi:hypothetical protein ACQPZF_36045 [Actinosynnema sp. CS-041913]|uniref:hypothetical protein n=1 Tax=Actinosynnema sp. CS-041913 TaxID=3239917 RepID=UPI003D8BECD4
MAGTGRHAVHRTMVLVDVEGFGAPTRTLPHQLGTRAGLYEVVGEARAAVGVPWDVCYHEDRGDGVFLLVPPEYPKAPLVEVLPEALARAVRGHNTTSHDAARARLRLAVHAGKVAFDEHGVTSTALTSGFRLLDAAPLKKALADSPGVVAMIVSRLVFDEVVRHSATVDAATFRPVEVTVKEVRDLAWLALPDHPYQPDHAVLATRPPGPTSLGTAPGGHAATGNDGDVGGNGPGNDGAGPRGVSIAGGVHGGGSGITIGAATGDHLTVGLSPVPPAPLAAGESKNPR